jgi:hypothetical protein
MIMREHLFELSLAELKNLYIHETKALIFALEAGAAWEDMQYLRDSLKDVTKYINARTLSSEHQLRKKSVEIVPPYTLTTKR